VEIVCGARRLFVARHLGKPLRVDVRNLSDREAIVLMDIENRQRMDVSPYERGLSYLRWLRSAHFRSQEDIARTLRISPSRVSRLLKLAQLPAVVLGAFPTPLEICETWGLEIMEALNDARRREPTIRRARAICARDPRPPATEVYRQLLSANVRGRRVRPAARDEIVCGTDGVPLFRIRQHRDSIALLVPMHKVSAGLLDSIRDSLPEILQAGSVLHTKENA
jgi:ParB family chromosome partitioning protein